MTSPSWLARLFARDLRRALRTGAWCAAAVVGVLCGVTGAGTGIERILADRGAALRAHDASGTTHIVEIDARSIAAIDRWPWPRSNYAAAVKQLRAAGARTIAFDVDFSARSSAVEDAAFAAELARANGEIILPTFGQAAGSGQEAWEDSLPIPALREHATLAAVSVLPDEDGNVRRAPVGAVTAGVPRPSLSAAIAGIAGAAGQDFPVDYAIRPGSIPRHSFIDVRDGRIAPGALAGKNVVIGATAIELGDRYGAPGWGVIPGVVIQALAAETLLRGRPVELGWAGPLLLAVVLGGLILRARSRRALTIVALASPLGIFALAVAAALFVHAIMQIAPALATLFVASAAAAAIRFAAAARRRASHDAATGLPNRRALHDAMRSYPGDGLLAARITEFERLSAGVGGDIAEIIHRVRDRIALVAEGATIYRVEDRVLAWRVYDGAEIDTRVKALRSAMLNPVEVSGRRVDVALALGYAPETGEADKILANAILAADRAVGTGSGWHAHDAGDDERLDLELSLLGELDAAIGKDEIQVHYQPKLDLRTGRIASVEALVRWQHNTRGFLRPDLFIPLAERNDRIADLTLHVLQRTIADLIDWETSSDPISGAVNLSAKLLTAPDFVARLRDLVDRSGIDPRRLVFEVTESAAMDDPAAAAAALRSFSDIGIAISMDDYGTGQSTLSYIKQLPLDELKIDRSFVQFAHQNRGDGVLVRSTIELAHELGLKVVAEGVEDEECLAFLRSAGCDMVQGYLISKPVPAIALLALLHRETSQAA